MQAPPYVGKILRKLEEAGHEAWCVGGCVRDALLGREPADWDVCTSALPQETEEALALPVLKVGERHGTLAALTEGGTVEVTTYRREGGYSDHRRPDQVVFSRRLEDDLVRRDFTINAMAWHPQRGLRDFFGGREDLHKGRIRCVGEPRQRFHEDALRLLRALRFAAVLGFDMEEDTEKALFDLAGLLGAISAERVQAELDKLLLGAYAEKTLVLYADVFRAVLPEVLYADVALPQGPGADSISLWAALLGGLAPGQADGVLRRMRFSNRRRQAVLRRMAGDPLPLGQLAVQGRDLLGLGVAPGPGMGEVLRRLLEDVRAGESPNEREALLERAKRYAGP